MKRLLKKCFRRVIGVWRIGRWVEFRIYGYIALLREASHAPKGLPLSKRIWAIRNGHQPNRLVLFGLTPQNKDNYIPEIWFERVHPWNGRLSSLIDSKLQLVFTLKDFPHLLPEVFFFVRGGMAFTLGNNLPACRRYEPRLILELLDHRHKLFLKPDCLSGGVGAHLLEKRHNGLFLDGRESSQKAVEELLTKLDDHLICECVEQHAYARNFFPGSANTIRLISIRYDDQVEPTFIVAFHRVGTRCSQPADNLGAGGLYGKIDMETGELGSFATYPKALKMEWHTHHPETGAQLAGVVVPRWKEIKNTVMEVSKRHSYMTLLAYDVVLTETEIKILEINSLPTFVSQAWDPLMLNKDAAAFFKKHIPQLR